MPYSTPFEPKKAIENLKRMWSLKADFGMERSSRHIYLDEVVSDRFALCHGFVILRDELQLAPEPTDEAAADISACRADFTMPSVLSTVAKTNCGDRIHQGEATTNYHRLVASRFATMSEIGDLKLEAFSPTGGGTDDGATLAHVTIAHHVDDKLRTMVYLGNASSYVLAGFDLQTHVGRLDRGTQISFGQTRESEYRDTRAACGAIIGTLYKYDSANHVHRRLRNDLGEANYEYLSKTKVLTEEGSDITAVVAAAIVALRGMEATLKALEKELDERGLAHVTASITVNRPSTDDLLIYLGRGTVFNGRTTTQGFGMDARAYRGRLVEHKGERRLVLGYGDSEGMNFEIKRSRYEAPHGSPPHAEGALDY